MNDLRHSIRMLASRPLFTLIAVLTLGLGIGASSTIFSVINAFLFRPLPVKDAENLVVLASKDKHFEYLHYLSYPDFLDYKDKSGALSDAAVYLPTPINLSAGGNAERVWAQIVSGNYFTMLGVEAAVGRTILPDDDKAPGASPAFVLSDSYWQRRFGGDPSIIGSGVIINGQPFVIVGVTPKEFAGTQPFLQIDGYIPLMMADRVKPGSQEKLEDRENHWLRTIARLKPGVGIDEAKQRATVLSQQLEQEYPKTNKDVRVLVIPETKSRPDVGVASFLLPFAAIFMALVGLVQLITCTNFANMLLVRMSARQKEIAIRLSLGASRWRVRRLFVTEGLLFGILGGAAGLAIAYLGTSLLSSIELPGDSSVRWFGLTPDWRVFTFTLIIGIVTGLFASIMPTLQSSKVDLSEALKEGGRASTGGPGRQRVRKALLISQIAISVLVLISAGLFIKSLQNAKKIDLGFRTDNLLLLSTDVGLQGYDQTRGQEFYSQVIDRVKRLPGVESASLANLYPFSTRGTQFMMVYFQEGLTGSETNSTGIPYNVVGLNYFDTMGIDLLQGRDFTERDNSSSPKVVIINRVMAKRFWPGQDVLGKRLSFSGAEGPYLQIVGVVEESKYVTIGEQPRSFMYIPFAQNYRPLITLHVHTRQEPTALVAPIREVVREMDANMPLFGVVTMASNLSDGLALLPIRIGAILAGTFGALVLSLTLAGIYGVVSYSVNTRTHEIGLRMALGAQKSQVFTLIVGEGMRLAVIGVIVGLVLTFLSSRLLTSMLYGVSATDPLTIVVVTVIVAMVTFLACYLPARRASSVDPMAALRHE